MKLLFFVPGPQMAPGMVMASGLERLRRVFGRDGSRFLISCRGLDLRGLVADLRHAERTGEPLAIMGATHGLDYFLDACLAHGIRFRLPAGSRLVDSGGFMGRYRGCKPEVFSDKCEEVLGIGREWCINAFWVCESGTVYFDTGMTRQGTRHCKLVPPWARVEIVHPLTFQPVEPGETGLIRLYDIANLGMAGAVQTDKVGFLTPDGFEVIGKLDRSDPQGGCDPRPAHPGGKVASRMMEFMMRKKLSRIGRLATPAGPGYA